MLALVRDRGGNVDPLRIVERDRRVGDRHDRGAFLVQELREVGADVAEALHRRRHRVEAPVALRDGVADAVERTACGRLFPPE